ncbi:MAG TPA: hypothetical protein VF832_03085 [Longimicrobiales bacterium]
MRVHGLRFLLVLALVALPAAAARGQGAAGKSQEQLRALFDAHKGDFDYLLGDWRFTAENKQYGKFGGFWSAVRLANEGQVLDEFRVVGDSGQTYDLSSTLRSYNALEDRWELVTVGSPNGLQNLGTGQRVGDEMHIEQRFGVGGPNPSTFRIRYYDIGPDHFSWNADRSTDGGKTWVKDFYHIEARRIGPARAIAPLTHADKAAPGSR